MRKIIYVVTALFIASIGFGQGRVYVSKVSPNETPVLDDGEIAVGVLQDGEPVQLRYGDGVTTGGRTLYDSRAVVRVSPVAAIEDGDFTISLAGSAYWTNGVICLFPPSNEQTTNVGYVILRITSPEQRIKAVRTQDVGKDYSLTASIAADGLSATLAGRSVYMPYPGAHPVMDGYIESFSVDVYTDGDSVGATNDLRGLTVLLNHPEPVQNATNAADFKAITMGWYSAHVQDAVARWSTHGSMSDLAMHHAITMDDGLNGQQRFRWVYKSNGYMTLQHESDTIAPVFSVEAMDPFPWIVSGGLARVSTLLFTTNGVSGSWGVQSATNLAGGGVWTNAVILATNEAPAGYMSLTVSNTLAGPVHFFRVACADASQASTRARWDVPVMAPRFYLAEGVYLIWESGGLRLHNGASNGAVTVTY